MSVPEYPCALTSTSILSGFARPYIEAFDNGDAALIKDGMDRAYGRPTQMVSVEQGIAGINPADLEEGDIATLERLSLERIQVERGS